MNASTLRAEDSITNVSGPVPDEPPFDIQTYYLIEGVLQIAITGIIALFGMMGNFINLVVFYRIGIFSSSNTVSLTGLAISDLSFCIAVMLGIICLGILRLCDACDLEYDLKNFHVLASVLLRHTFSQSTCFITTSIALERFVAVVFPLKVKKIFTPKRALFIMCGCFFVAFLLEYVANLLTTQAWETSSKYSFPLLTNPPLDQESQRVLFNVLTYSFITLRIGCFTTVAFCNIRMFKTLTLRRVRRCPFLFKGNNNAWQDLELSSFSDTPTSNAGSARSIADKKRTHTRMMLAICTLFIVCLTPVILSWVVSFPMSNTYHWFIGDIIYMFSVLSETINSSCNIIIYHRMSSQYKQQFPLCLQRRRWSVSSGT